MEDLVTKEELKQLDDGSTPRLSEDFILLESQGSQSMHEKLGKVLLTEARLLASRSRCLPAPYETQVTA